MQDALHLLYTHWSALATVTRRLFAGRCEKGSHYPDNNKTSRDFQGASKNSRPEGLPESNLSRQRMLLTPIDFPNCLQVFLHSSNGGSL